MAYLIDGHNLIPKIRNLSLESMDDEMELVVLLQEFCQRRQKQVEVFFDNAPPGQPRARNFGNVIARFIPSPQTADQAIHNKLIRLGASARNWTVVSSDHAVQGFSRAARAQVLTSEAFARLIEVSLKEDKIETKRRSESAMSEAEVDEWMRLFGDKTNRSDE
jgi:predicted RNA-binding protein with PIN domain